MTATGAALFAVDASSAGVDSAAARTWTRPATVRISASTARPHSGWRGVSRRIAAVVDDVLIVPPPTLSVPPRGDEPGRRIRQGATQFDQPIGSFQAVQHLCVDMYETVELARSGVIHALWAADAAEPAERHLAALRAKAFAGRLAAVGDTAIQVFGGIGFTWEHDAHLYLKRLLGWSAFLGAPDRYLEEVGAHLGSSDLIRRRVV